MHPLLLGIGNEFRSDDGAGIAVAREVAAAGLAGVDVREMSGEGTALIEAWNGRTRVILVDAVSVEGGVPGTIHRLQAHRQPVPSGFFRYSTHDFGLSEAVEMSRQLGTLPPTLAIFGIQGANFDYGTTLTAAVADAVVRAAEEIVTLLRTI
jgi:hydrogenase maturation protease